MHYITLRYVTLHYITLHYITLHYITLHYITLHYITLHYITLHYITLHYITLHYITLHYITLHYITLHYITLHYITLRYVTFFLLVRLTIHGESRYPTTSRKNCARLHCAPSATTCSFGFKPRSSLRLAFLRDSPEPSHRDFSSLSDPPSLTAPHCVQKNTFSWYM